MATSIIAGLSGRPDCPIIRASSRDLSSLSHLPIPSTLKFSSNLSASQSAAVILLSVKPHVAPAVLKEISPVFEGNPDPPTLLSVVGGLSTDTILKHIAAPAPIIRAMPNTPAKYKAAITAICPGAHASESHIMAAKSVMLAVGAVVELPEYQIPAFTAIAGAGVAYVFLFAEAMADAAVSKGLPRKTAMEVVAQTVKGAGYCLEGGVHPAILRNEVESPGGITIAGTGALEKGGLRGSVWQAVEEVVKKDAEIDKGA